MGLNYFASSPTVVLPPQQPPSYFDNFNPQSSSPALSPSSCPVGRKYPVPPSLNYLAAANNSTAGRKRSIHDVEPDDLPADGATLVQPKPRGEPIYGPGMTLIYPDDPSFSISAESQTGTWAEEKQAKIEKETPPPRPIAVSRKSQRLDTSAKSASIPSLNDTQAVIDENGNTINNLIVALGIGWKNVMTNPNLSIVAKAYARVIENHFPLSDVTIMLQSEALTAYLVRASEAGAVKYWLFDDSLRWCQLLSTSLQGAVNNLRAGPVPAVEGPIINSTPRTPPPTSAPNADINMANEGNAASTSVPAEGNAMEL